MERPGDEARPAGLGEETAPLPERSLTMPAWIAGAFAGHDAPPPEVAEPAQPGVLLPDRLTAAAESEGRTLASGSANLLVLRAACPAEGEALAKAAIAAAGLVPCHLTDTDAAGLGAWLAITGRLPIVHRTAGPGDTIDLSAFDRLPCRWSSWPAAKVR